MSAFILFFLCVLCAAVVEAFNVDTSHPKPYPHPAT